MAVSSPVQSPKSVQLSDDLREAIFAEVYYMVPFYFSILLDLSAPDDLKEAVANGLLAFFRKARDNTDVDSGQRLVQYFHSELAVKSIVTVLKACSIDFVQTRLFHLTERIAKYTTSEGEMLGSPDDIKGICKTMLDHGILGHMEAVLQRHTSKNDPLIGAVRECFTVIQLQYLEQEIEPYVATFAVMKTQNWNQTAKILQDRVKMLELQISHLNKEKRQILLHTAAGDPQMPLKKSEALGLSVKEMDQELEALVQKVCVLQEELATKVEPESRQSSSHSLGDFKEKSFKNFFKKH